MKRYETDVLVLGAGAVGCGAAVAAAGAGTKVLLLDKGCLESSGSLGGGNDHFMCVLDQEEHDGLEDIIRYYSTPISGFPSQGKVYIPRVDIYINIPICYNNCKNSFLMSAQCK